MKKTFLKDLSLLFFSLVLLFGCGESSGNLSELTEALKVEELRIKIPDSTVETMECTSPRPPAEGCTTICKPCKYYICVNGEWKAFNVNWDPRYCNRGSSRENPACACPTSPGGFCPAECCFCFNSL